jgi:hypothetical protein
MSKPSFELCLERPFDCLQSSANDSPVHRKAEGIFREHARESSRILFVVMLGERRRDLLDLGPDIQMGLLSG